MIPADALDTLGHLALRATEGPNGTVFLFDHWTEDGPTADGVEIGRCVPSIAGWQAWAVVEEDHTVGASTWTWWPDLADAIKDVVSLQNLGLQRVPKERRLGA